MYGPEFLSEDLLRRHVPESPGRTPAWVQAEIRLRLERLGEAEVEDLHEVSVTAIMADVQVLGFDVTVDQVSRVRLAQGVTGLLQPVRRSPRFDRPELVDEVFGVDACQ